jgi:hypothetical protein
LGRGERAPDTLTAIVERGGPVKVSFFFGVPELPRLRSPDVAKENGLQVASLLDLAGTKASVVQTRAEARDYIDMDALMRLGKTDLPTALAAASRIYGRAFNPGLTLKALCYFEDGNLRGLPEDMKLRLATAAREVDLDRLPAVEIAQAPSRAARRYARHPAVRFGRRFPARARSCAAWDRRPALVGLLERQDGSVPAARAPPTQSGGRSADKKTPLVRAGFRGCHLANDPVDRCQLPPVRPNCGLTLKIQSPTPAHRPVASSRASRLSG